MTGGVQAAAGCAAAAGAWAKRATVTAAPSTSSGTCGSVGAGTCDVLVGSFTATPVGGNGVYTYQWEQVSTTASSISFGSASSASTTVTVTGTKAASPGAVYTTVVRCRVSSPSGPDVFSNNVTITTTHVVGTTVQLSNQSYSDTAVSPTNAFVSYELQNDGDIIRTIRATATDVGDWISPKTDAPGLYECRATLNSGSVNAGSSATGSWLALTSTRFWACQRTSVGTQSANLTIEIRNNGGATLASCTVALSATVET